MTALWERLQQVLDEHKDLNPSKWSLDAKLPRETVRLAIRERRDSMELKTLTALADAAGVSFLWLATGKLGWDIEDDAKYPTRPRALAAGRIVGYSDAAIAAVAAVDDLETDPGTEHWLHLLAAKNLQHAQVTVVSRVPARLPAPPSEKPGRKPKR